MSRRICLKIAFGSPFRDSIAAISLSPAMNEASGRAFVRARSAYARRKGCFMQVFLDFMQ